MDYNDNSPHLLLSSTSTAEILSGLCKELKSSVLSLDEVEGLQTVFRGKHGVLYIEQINPLYNRPAQPVSGRRPEDALSVDQRAFHHRQCLTDCVLIVSGLLKQLTGVVYRSWLHLYTSQSLLGKSGGSHHFFPLNQTCVLRKVHVDRIMTNYAECGIYYELKVVQDTL